MNQFVQRWKKHESAPRHAGPDSIALDDVKYKFSQEVVSEKSKTMKNPDHKVGYNAGLLQDFALYGAEGDVRALCSMTLAALNRLKIRRFRGVAPFTRTVPFMGAKPSLHDIKRWLDDISLEPKYAQDVEFLKRLHVTMLNRDFTPPADEE